MGSWGLPPPPLFKRRRHDRETWMTYIYTYVGLGHFLGVQNFKFQYFGGFSEKSEYFLGYEDCVDIFWGNHKTGLYLEVISMHFTVFS